MVLDSGCSFHMCPHKNWFASYKSCDGAQVLLRNNKSCKVTIGSIKLKLADGTERVLRDVRLVLELKRNIVSLRMLEPWFLL